MLQLTHSIPKEQKSVAPSASAVRSVHNPVDWGALVSQIKAGEEEGMERLYKIFGGGVRYYLCHQLGPQELNDNVHDTFLTVVRAIKQGHLREPERLMGFVRTIVRRQIAALIEQAVSKRRDVVDIELGGQTADRRRDPEQEFAIHQRDELIGSALEAMSQKDREVLTRFYLKEQSQAQICCEMKLTETQFRLLKSRAKTKFGDIGKKTLRPAGSFLSRTKVNCV